MNIPHVGVSYIETCKTSLLDEFISEINRDDLELLVEGRPEPGPFACAEWFIPTAIAIFVGKPYFEAFLKEMGKDHYNTLKQSISRLCQKTISSRRFEPVIMSSPNGKVNDNNPYTLSFSVIADTGNGYSFRLLLPKYGNDFNYQDAINKFMDFIADYHSEGELSRAYEIIKSSGIPGGPVLVKYNPENTQIEWQDYLPPEIREKANKKKTDIIST